MEPKPWYLSTKIWIAIVGEVSGLSMALSGVEALTIPGIVAAVLSAFIAVLRIIEGRSEKSAEQPISNPLSSGAGMAVVALLFLWAAPSCDHNQREDAKPWVGAGVDVAAVLACGPTIEAFCAEGRPLHGDDRCADWKLGCAIGEPFVLSIVANLFKAPLADDEVRPEAVAEVCALEGFDWCDRVGAGARVLMLPGAGK